MTTSAWRKLNRAPRVVDCRCPHRVLRRAQATAGADLFRWVGTPPWTATTTTPTAAVRQEEEEQPGQLGPQRGRWRLRQPQLQGSGCQRTLAHRLQPLDRLYPDVTKSRGYRATGVETTSGHDGSRALLQLSASVGRACLCVTSYPPWAHAAARPAIAWTGVETVDWVLGLAVPRQLVRHHDAELSCHHGLGRRLWRLQPYHA
jgi:hypothetical protein